MFLPQNPESVKAGSRFFISLRRHRWPSGPAKDGIVMYRDGTLYVIRSREKISLLEVYDGAGRMVFAERPGREEISVNSERYPKGVFFFKVHTGGSVITKKVLH